MTPDATAAPRARTDIADVRYGAGTVLFENHARRLHTLNSSAALVWRRLDGSTTLGDISRSLAETFAADRSVIEGDVAAVVGRFDSLGLLHDAATDAADLAPAPEGPDDRSVRLREQLDAIEWAAYTPTFQALRLSFRIRSEDPDVVQEVARVFGSLRSTADHADHLYSVRFRVHEGVAQWRVYFDGVAVKTVPSAEAAIALIVWHLDRTVIERSPGVLFFRGSAVQFGERVVMFPGASGAARSMLTTALVRRGLSYVSTGEIAWDVASGRVLAFPKAIVLDAVGRAHFPELFDPADASPDDEDGQWLLDPAAIPGATLGTGGRVALVIEPNHVPGATTRVERVVDVDTLRMILDSTYPFDHLGTRGFHALAALTQEVAVFRLDFDDLEAACEVVLQLAREIR